MRDGEVHDGSRFTLTHHVRTCAARVVWVFVLEVAVQVYSTGSVFVVEAVLIVVRSFPIHRIGA